MHSCNETLENEYLARFFAVIYKISLLLAGEKGEMDIGYTINSVHTLSEPFLPLAPFEYSNHLW